MKEKYYTYLQRAVKFIKIGGIAFICLIFLFFAMDKFIMPWYVGSGNVVNLPDVTEKDYANALVELQRLGFRIVKEGKYDPYGRPGLVLSQKPLPFTTVKKGRLITLTVSLGERMVTVPNLMGVSERDAEIKLLESNLKLGEVNYQFSTMPEGTVISQQYESETELSKNMEVSITVSSGEVKDEVVMPAVINKNFKDASDMVKKQGLFPKIARYDVRNELLPNTVVFTSPVAGTVLIPGDTVMFIVSRIDSGSVAQKDK